MPALTEKNTTVLVTGANGYIATYIIGDLLKEGFSVRAAVRTLPKADYLKSLYKDYEGKLSAVAVGDISKDGAFDEAVKGVDAIIHTASPVHLGTPESDPSELIDPAVKGFLNILDSALKYAGSQLQRIVFSSSCAAILDFALAPVTISEKDWNDVTIQECKEKGKDAGPLAKYSASKTTAEHAAWEWYDKHKSEISWDITMINPPWVFGPPIHDVPSLSALNSSQLFFYNAVVKGDFGGYPPNFAPGHGWSDVRDTAYAHVKALQTPAAGGERIIICAESYVWADLVQTAHSLNPQPYTLKPLPTLPADLGPIVRAITFDTTKEKTILGLKFRSREELVRDSLADFQKRGF